MKNKEKRPLNKKELALYARIYLGSMAFYASDVISHISELSEKEVESIEYEVMIIGNRLLGSFSPVGDPIEIITQIKAGRK